MKFSEIIASVREGVFTHSGPLAVRRDRVLLADTSTVVTMFFGVGDQVEVGLL